MSRPLLTTTAPSLPPGDVGAPAYAAAPRAGLAAAWAGAPERWRGLVRHVPGGRWYHPLPFEALDGDEPISAWLITWAPGTGLDLHDHGGSAGTLAVVGGELTEWHTTTAGLTTLAGRAGRGGPRLHLRRLTDGSVTTFGADHAHAVRNDGLEPAVSIHVYVPGLTEMSFYDAPAPDRPGVTTRTADPMENLP
jgi:hypothetical protein